METEIEFSELRIQKAIKKLKIIKDGDSNK